MHDPNPYAYAARYQDPQALLADIRVLLRRVEYTRGAQNLLSTNPAELTAMLAALEKLRVNLQTHYDPRKARKAEMLMEQEQLELEPEPQPEPTSTLRTIRQVWQITGTLQQIDESGQPRRHHDGKAYTTDTRTVLLEALEFPSQQEAEVALLTEWSRQPHKATITEISKAELPRSVVIREQSYTPAPAPTRAPAREGESRRTGSLGS